MNEEVPVGDKAARLSHPDPRVLDLLPGASFADSYRWRYSSTPLEAAAWLGRILGKPPRWVGGLMTLRNAVAAGLGLKQAAVTGFPVLHSSPECIVVGMDDRHLDFRIACFCDRAPDGAQQVTMGTVVRPHNLAGRAYLAVVMPFHRVISSTLTGRASTQPTPMDQAVSRR